MSPAVYVVFGVLLTLLATAFFTFAAYFYYLALQIKALAEGVSELAFALQGLPHNLHGVSPALSRLADGVVAHEKQMGGLVAVIKDANKAAPPEAPPPFEPDGRDTNWAASIPQSAFDDGNQE